MRGFEIRSSGIHRVPKGSNMPHILSGLKNTNRIAQLLFLNQQQSNGNDDASTNPANAQECLSVDAQKLGNHFNLSDLVDMGTIGKG